MYIILPQIGRPNGTWQSAFVHSHTLLCTLIHRCVHSCALRSQPDDGTLSVADWHDLGRDGISTRHNMRLLMQTRLRDAKFPYDDISASKSSIFSNEYSMRSNTRKRWGSFRFGCALHFSAVEITYFYAEYRKFDVWSVEYSRSIKRQ